MNRLLRQLFFLFFLLPISSSAIVPSVTIGTSPSAAICLGTPLIFTATPVNGGTTPAYQWQKNGINVGTNSASYIDGVLTTGDTITVMLTSNDPTASPATVTSTPVIMTVNPRPGIVTNATAAAYCSGVPVTVTAASPATGNALDFPGVNNNVSIPSAAANLINTPAFTVQAWIYPRSNTAQQIILFKGQGCTNWGSWFLGIGGSEVLTDAGKLVFGIRTANTSAAAYVKSPTVIEINAWTHVAATYDGTSMKLYLNGVKADSIATTGIPYTNASPLGIGQDPGCGGRFNYNGRIDELEIWNQARDVRDIVATMALAMPQTTTGLTASYRFDEADGIYTYDQMGNTIGRVNGGSITHQVPSTSPMSNNATGATTYAWTPTTGLSPTAGAVVGATPAAATIYTVTATNTATGCTGTANVQIKTGTAPTATITPAGPLVSCADELPLLTAGVATTYQWYQSGAPIANATAQTYTPNAVGIYNITVRVSNANECVATSLPVVVTGNPNVKPSVSFTASPGVNVDANTLVTFAATPVNGGIPVYRWRLNGTNVGTNSNVYTNNAWADGDIVTCMMVTSLCTKVDTVYCDRVIHLKPTVTLTSTGSCVGSILTINSTIPPTQASLSVNGTPGPVIPASWNTTGTVVAGGNGAGNASNQLSGPWAVSVDANQNVYVAEINNARVTKWIPGATTGTIVAGTGTGGSALTQIAGPDGVAVDGSGRIYVAEYSNGRITRWSPGATTGVLVAGSTSGNALNQMNGPSTIYVDSVGNIYVPEFSGARVTRWSPGDSVGTIVAGGNGAGAALNQLNAPNGVYVDAAGNVYVTEYSNPRVVKWAPGATTGVVIAGGNGIGAALNQLSNSIGNIIVDGLGNYYVADAGNNRILRYAPGSTTGVVVAGGNGAGNGLNQFNAPVDMRLDRNGNLYVADLNNHRVLKFTPNTNLTYMTGPGGSYTATVTTFGGAAATSAPIIISPLPLSIADTSAPVICNGQSVAITAAPALQGNTLDLNGSVTSYVSIPHNTATSLSGSNSFTVSAWIYPRDTTSFQSLALKGLGCSSFENWYFRLGGSASLTDPGKVVFGFHTSNSSAGSFVTSTAKLPINTWTHVAITYNGANLLLYINGTLNNSAVATGTPWASTEKIYIGSDPGCGGRLAFNGRMDEFQIWNTVRSVQDIVASYNGLVPPASANLGGYWRFDERNGNTAYDVTANGNHGTLNGNASRQIPSTAPIGNAASGAVTYAWAPVTSITPATGATVTANPASTTDYTITTTHTASGCFNTNVVRVKVNQLPVVTVTPPGPITPCSNVLDSLKASVAAGYIYQWFRGATNLGNTNFFYVPSSSGNYTVQVTDANSCRTTSAPVTVTVIPAVAPSVSIAANPSSTICNGTNVTFTATPVNGGGSPVYQWRKNGINAGINSATYSDNALATGDVISVRMKTSVTCPTIDTVNSNAVTMTVNSVLVPSVIIASSTTGAICAGTNVIFTATPVNGGSTPIYQWRKNGTGVGINSNTYSDNALANGDVITLRLTSNETCRTLDTANSNIITMSVNTIQVPSVMVSANPGTTICAGTNVTFTATPVNGGGTPVYQWRKNGVSVGTNSNTYSDNGLVNNDKITVRLTSNATCRNVDTVNSTQVTITVNPILVPSVTVSANPGNTICLGTNVTFTAAPVSGGAIPAYQWKKNGTNVGTNSTAYADNALVNGDVITVRLTSNATCRTLDTTNSTGITMTVNMVPAQPGVISGNTRFCGNSTQTYGIAPVITATSYTWTFPTGWSGSSTTNSISATAPVASGTGVITVTANNSCGPSVARTLADTVINTPVQPGTITGNATVCSGTAQGYNIAPVNEATSYTWAVPTGWAATASTTTSVNTTAGSASGTGNITVTASNQCGTSTVRNFAVSVINTPAQPANITGAAQICGGSTQAYTINAVTDATSYTWTLPAAPAGWTGSSATTSLSATAPATPGTGTLSVAAVNGCGSSTPRTLSVAVVTTPAAPAAVSGSAAVCGGITQSYFTAPVDQATSYLWTVPAGWSAPAITGSSIATTPPVTTGTGNGAVTVKASNVCGTSAAASLAVTVTNIPAQPAAIAGNANVCGGTAQIYKIPKVAEAAAYTWTVPGNGWTVAPGSATDTFINTTAGTAANTVSVTASNQCGTSPVRTLAVSVTNVPGTAGAITGPDSVCTGSGAVTFATGQIAEAASYTWTLPPGWTGTSATSQISGTPGSAAATGAVTVKVTGTNSCGNGPSAQKTIIVNNPVTPAVALSGPSGTQCAGNALVWTATPSGGGLSPLYQWKVNGVNQGAPGLSNTFTSSALNTGDVVSVQMRTSLPCATTPGGYALASAGAVTISPQVMPGININATAPPDLCKDVPVTFYANTTGGGSAPVYRWSRNGTVITGATGPSYTLTGPANGDTLQVTLISNARCRITDSVASNKMGLSVSPYVSPVVSISANPGTAIGAGQTVIFTAAVANAGANPEVRWKRNGLAVAGTTGLSWTTSTLRDGDVISADLVSGARCATPFMVTSVNTLQMRVSTGVSTVSGPVGSISLYPNPSSGAFTVQVKGTALSNGRGRIGLEVLSATGQLVWQLVVAPDTRDWSVDVHLPAATAPGMYLIRIAPQDNPGNNTVLKFRLEQ